MQSKRRAFARRFGAGVAGARGGVIGAARGGVIGAVRGGVIGAACGEVTGAACGTARGTGGRMEASGCHVSEPSSQHRVVVSTLPEARRAVISSTLWGP